MPRWHTQDTLYLQAVTWYLVTNLAGHLDLAEFYVSKCPTKFNRPHFHLVMERAQV